MLEGRPFRFAGANNYYPMYKSPFMVDDLLETAERQGFTVFRAWAALEIGNADGTNTTHSGGEGVSFHYWDTVSGAPAFNDGESGLVHLDYVVAKASELGLKLVLPLVNNWQDFGGMDQYVRWRQTALGDSSRSFYHSDFYTDPQIKQWYKDWITHLLQRRNVFTGVQYKDEPAIMTWELANEPRCGGSGVYPRSPDCNVSTLTAWADEMSTFIKSIDRRHLVSSGDEGFLCDPGATDWTENCGEGVDSVALASLPNMDVLSYHLYPDHWGKTAEWGTDWIARHIESARVIGKPAMLGEFGWQEQSSRNTVFKAWTDEVETRGGAGALYWILSGLQDDGSLYPDYDRFTVYCDSPVCTLLSRFAESITRPGLQHYAPIADHDVAVTDFDTPVVLTPAGNDVAYGRANAVVPERIDLDPSTPGQQALLALDSGIFQLLDGGQVEFTPASGFHGSVVAPYAIQDRHRQLSNQANLSVTVNQLPGQPIQLFSFETGTEGWNHVSWEPTAGTVSQTSELATAGAYGLAVDSQAGGWFGLSFAQAIDLSDGYTALELDLLTGADGTWHNIAIQVGANWTWCQGPGVYVPPSTFTTMQLNLLEPSCGSVDLSQINALFVYFNGDGALDNVRAR